MKNKILLALLFLVFSYLSFNIQLKASTETQEEKQSEIIIEGVKEGEKTSKPNIKYYLTNPHFEVAYEITFENNLSYPFTISGERKNIALPLSENGNYQENNPLLYVNDLKAYRLLEDKIIVITKDDKTLEFKINDGIIELDGRMYTSTFFENKMNENNLLITSENGCYVVAGYNTNIEIKNKIKSFVLIKEEKTKIVSAKLNGVDFKTNTTLKPTIFENGDYTLEIIDSRGNIKTINFKLANDPYIVEVMKALMKGTLNSTVLFVITLLFGIPLGLIGCLLKKVDFKPFKSLKQNKKRLLKKITKFNPLRFILDVYTWVIRGTPLLLQLFVVYFGLPIMFGDKFSLKPMEAACITFVINYVAYFIEIFRGGMETINKGQFSACYVLGMTKTQTYLRIIIPQTIKKVLPSITNEAITLVKDTALASVITVADLLFYTKQKVSLDFRMDAYFVAGVIYLVFSFIIVYFFTKLEKKNSYYN